MDFLGLFDPSAGGLEACEGGAVVGLDACKGGAVVGTPLTDQLCYDIATALPYRGASGQLLPPADLLQLPPEPQLGNIEYKLKLLTPSKQRFEHLVTQMKWRLREGQGEAIYELGVEDSGRLKGLSESEMESSMATLRRMADELGATLTLLRHRSVSDAGLVPSRVVAELLVRKIPDDRHNIDLRVAVLGNAGAGKSTLLGVLTHGELDNGRGRSRLNMLRHLHEIQSGRTSSISHEILGFDGEGNTVDYSSASTTEEICERSSKLLTFIDLAGHQKYLKTTIHGLTGYSPHHVMLVVAANNGIVGTTREHLGLALALQVPLFVIVTKVDLTSRARLRHTLHALESMLKGPGCGKVPLRVRTVDDVLSASTQTAPGAPPAPVDGVVPIFSVSSVSGAGLRLLKQFLYVLSPGMSSHERERLEQELCEFQIDETFRISDTGVVVGGLLTKGVIAENMPLNIGPLDDGSYACVRVGSIHRNRRACRVVRAGQAAALAIDRDIAGLRKGMVLLAPQTAVHCCLYFQATVCVLFRTTELHRRCQTTVHLGSVCQSAVIEAVIPAAADGDRLHDDHLQPDQEASALFRFLRQPEYVCVGDRLLFRQGRVRGYGMGTVTKVFPFRPDEADVVAPSDTP